MTRILIVSTNALGDTYLSSAAIRPIRKFYNACEIHFVSLENSKLFLEYLDIDKCFFLKSKDIVPILEIMKEIKRINYDYVFSFFPGVINSLIYLYAKSQKKAGFINLIRKKQWYNNINKATFRDKINKQFIWNPEMNYLLRISKLLQITGIESSEIVKPMFPIKIQDHSIIDKNTLTIHYKARDKNRSLTDSDILELCDRILQNHNVKISLLGGERDFSATFTDQCNKKNIYLLNETLFPDMLATILNSKLYIGVDSFPLHLADAYNINFLGIFGPTLPNAVLTNYKKSVIFDYGVYLNVNFPLLLKRVEEVLN
ncbi:MAG: glycosyltransferase family 9 protein [Ignavibacteriaceae bacterium]